MWTYWWDYWRAFWPRQQPSPTPKPLCSIDDLIAAFDEYLASSKEVTERAARNVEEARFLKAALEENIANGRRLKEALEDIKERKRQSAQVQCDTPPPQARR